MTLHPMSSRLGAALLAWALSGCGGGGGGDGGMPTTGGAPGVAASFSIPSAQTGISYDVRVYLPPEYAQSTTRYPVVYAMDLENRYPTLTGVLQRTGRKVILVSVAAMSGARRWVDFTMPGAESYYRFVTLELIPIVESQYRVDPATRTLSGHSLSGEFVMYALYLENPGSRYFKSIVSAEGSLWFDAQGNFSRTLELPAAMEQRMFDTSRQLPVNLVLAADTGGYASHAGALYQHLSRRGYVGLNATVQPYSLGHVPMDGPSFADAMDFIYGPVQ